MNKTAVSIITTLVILVVSHIGVANAAQLTLAEKLNGRILLQVQQNGEAWYVNPVDSKRYFLGRPANAFELMRTLGLGISNSDFDSFEMKAPTRLSGRILLKVQDAGKAYYVNSEDLTMHYLGLPADAFQVMRNLGLGIADSDLAKIQIGELVKKEPQFSVISLAVDTKDPGGIKVELDFGAPAKDVAIAIKEKNADEALFSMKFAHKSGQTHFGTGSSSLYAGLMPNQTYVFHVQGTDQKTGQHTASAEQQFTTSDYLAFFLGLMPYHEPVQTDIPNLAVRRRSWDDGVRWQYRLYTPTRKQIAIRLNGSTVAMRQENDLTQRGENWKLVPFESLSDVLSLDIAPNSDTLLVIDQEDPEPLTIIAFP